MSLHVLLEIIASGALEFATDDLARVRSVSRMTGFMAFQVLLTLEGTSTAGMAALVLFVCTMVDKGRFPFFS